jgi:hypothetical protein
LHDLTRSGSGGYGTHLSGVRYGMVAGHFDSLHIPRTVNINSTMALGWERWDR